jgi:hypothetical protein
MKVEDLSIPRNVKQDLSTVLIYGKDANSDEHLFGNTLQ